ncbi:MULTISPECIES: glucose PTS transporter subunit IIA [unclassified Pseudoclavibacter]|uniref:glucose PTS transporter subunit IIA n=1 Tax=unclassified Pseudoclavibacter TaxID=2615177 RepID=UPI001BA70F94|nr:PTS glucose transporter subunit IIABC [Pseudoclavibacter sp. Marseille-Q4354]MBS3177266.1 PTS glucose transporter subunit IIA [Pseudoclavibacter sp. Marseille-Q4354]
MSQTELSGGIVAPLAGTMVAITDVPDPMFASKAMGDGFAVAPNADDVVAPCSGTVIMVAKTAHAFGIRTDDGLEVLVHMGIDTVELEGAPFAMHVDVDDRVEAGQPLGRMDLAAVEAAGKSTMTMVIFLNLAQKKGSVEAATGPIGLGERAATLDIPEQDADAPAAAPAATATTEASAQSAASPATAKTAVATGHPSGATGFDALAYDIVEGIGGKDNIRNVVHCITRVRFTLKDTEAANDDLVKNLDGVIDVIKAGGQYQVVIGPAVEDVYDAVVRVIGGTGEASPDDETVERPTTIVGWFQFGFSSLIGVITGSMIPVIGLLAASGILKGILALLTQFGVVESDSSTYALIDAMSSSMFYFLPIIIGFTAARRFGSDPIIVAIIGGVLVFPSVVSMSDPAADGYTVVSQLGNTIFNADFFGIPVALPQGNAYAYSIFPIIVAAYLASLLEPQLKKYIPAVVRMIFAPLLEVFIISTVMLVVFGPIIMTISGGIANGINGVLEVNYAIAGLIIGALYQCLVIFGLHWAVIPLVASQIAIDGSSPLNAIISATMVAQGGGALAIWIRTRSQKIKTLAGPATISAFCGITEPAMYGLNLKYGRVFITASAGGAVGGFLTGLMDVNMYGFTGAFVGFPSFVNPAGLDHSFFGFLIASTAALVVSFTLTYFFGYSDNDLETERAVKKVRLGKREPAGV